MRRVEIDPERMKILLSIVDKQAMSEYNFAFHNMDILGVMKWYGHVKVAEEKIQRLFDQVETWVKEDEENARKAAAKG